MNIAFFIRQFSERGTEVSTYDYADANETVLHNRSIIVSFTETARISHRLNATNASYAKFQSRFTVIQIDCIEDMSQVIATHNLHFFYTQTHGSHDVYQFENKNIWGSCKTIKHCVFTTRCPESDFHISISEALNTTNQTNIPVIPYIVSLPHITTTLHNELHIPPNATVFGRYGGESEFDISIAHDAIRLYLDENPNVYFVMMNTSPFYTHPRILYLPCTTNVEYKVQFINTCDAMIHARTMGETFGLAVAEFSIKNRPVITCQCGDTEHIRILGDKALLYNSTESLLDLFRNIKNIRETRTNWNAYELYSPENVMQRFDKLIFYA